MRETTGDLSHLNVRAFRGEGRFSTGGFLPKGRKHYIPRREHLTICPEGRALEDPRPGGILVAKRAELYVAVAITDGALEFFFTANQRDNILGLSCPSNPQPGRALAKYPDDGITVTDGVLKR